jgi:hypothetical protein
MRTRTRLPEAGIWFYHKRGQQSGTSEKRIQAGRGRPRSAAPLGFSAVTEDEEEGASTAVPHPHLNRAGAQINRATAATVRSCRLPACLSGHLPAARPTAGAGTGRSAAPAGWPRSAAASPRPSALQWPRTYARPGSARLAGSRVKKPRSGRRSGRTNYWGRPCYTGTGAQALRRRGTNYTGYVCSYRATHPHWPGRQPCRELPPALLLLLLPPSLAASTTRKSFVGLAGSVPFFSPGEYGRRGSGLACLWPPALLLAPAPARHSRGTEGGSGWTAEARGDGVHALHALVRAHRLPCALHQRGGDRAALVFLRWRPIICAGRIRGGTGFATALSSVMSYYYILTRHACISAATITESFKRG